MIFDQKDTRAMLHVAYVMEELAGAVEYLPVAPSQEALVAMAEHPASAADWSYLAQDVEMSAGYSAQMHERFGREALEGYRQYHEDLEREMATLQAMPRLNGRAAIALDSECDQCGQVKPVLYGQDACTLGYPGHPGAEWTTFQLCEPCLTKGR
jgi:hypothetical protein